jgi:hypothetical protein
MWIGLQIIRVLLDWPYLPRFLRGEALHSSARAEQIPPCGRTLALAEYERSLVQVDGNSVRLINFW